MASRCFASGRVNCSRWSSLLVLSLSSSSFWNASSNQRPAYSPAAARNMPMISCRSRGLNSRILFSRSTMIASVGVCTRPSEVTLLPRPPLSRRVKARVALMPTSQSASFRLRAALASGCISASLRNREKPSRMASGVIDCSQTRLIGFFVPAY